MRAVVIGIKRILHARDFIGYLIFIPRRPLGVDAKKTVCKQAAEEEAESPSFHRSFAIMICPPNRAHVIRKVEEDWVRIIWMAICLQGRQSRFKIDDNCHKLEDIYAHKILVGVVGQEGFCLAMNLMRPLQVPPEAKF